MVNPSLKALATFLFYLQRSQIKVYVNGILQMNDLLAYTPGGSGVGQ
ncbi:MAG: hypothetical protein ABF649_18170 [Bacillus sp. (in: firmicutes)]